MQGRGLKRFMQSGSGRQSTSPLMQGRGLKLLGDLALGPSPPSPLMQGRGLKHQLNERNLMDT